MEEMQLRMNDVESVTSDTTCLAKWLQSSVYLMNGFTHSCHHPSTHKIDANLLKDKPSAIHNTKEKLEFREQMLRGEQPSDCTYCWNIENMGNDYISDRTYKSTDVEWAYNNLDKVVASGVGEDINPSYLEVAFNNTCNMKCMYCTPDISSKWMEEVKQHGQYPTHFGVGNIDWLEQIGKMPIPNREHNPYQEAFWEWWDELYQELAVFRITGGEPLLSKHTWRILEDIRLNPRKELVLAINTNMCVDDDLIDKLIYYYNEISPNIKEFQVYTSVEAKGKQAEYIRFGMDYDQFIRNCKKFLLSTGDTSRLHYMITFNALSVTTFKGFLNDLWKMRVEFNPDDALNRLPMMISYLRWPRFQDVRILPIDIKEKYFKEIYDFVMAHTRNSSPDLAGRFYLEEINQIERLHGYMKGDVDDPVLERNDFKMFFNEYDNRKGTNFTETFPELAEWYNTL